MALKKEREYISGPTPIDESWWHAVLEDAEAQSAPSSNLNSEKSEVTKKGSSDKQASPQKDKKVPKETAPPNEVNWNRVERLYKQDLVINLEVVDHNRGGLLVNGDNIKGFVPTSHLVGLSKKSIKKDRKDLLSSYVGRSLKLKVIECDQERGRIVFSERAALTDPGSRLELLNTLQVGDSRFGRVTTITDFGVFVDLGGVEGLIHISELSWGRVCHPAEIVALGDEIEVYIMQINRERDRIALSLKRLSPNPWESVYSRYHIGQITSAVITNIVSFGAFARLEDGLDGLIHISEFGEQAAIQDIGDLIAEGQQVEVCILHIDSARQRLGLSLHTDFTGVM